MLNEWKISHIDIVRNAIVIPSLLATMCHWPVSMYSPIKYAAITSSVVTAPWYTISLSMPPAKTPSLALLGFCFMESPSASSRPSASAGSESVMRLIHRRCAGLRIVKFSIVASRIDSTSLTLVASRNCIAFLIFE